MSPLDVWGLLHGGDHLHWIHADSGESGVRYFMGWLSSCTRLDNTKGILHLECDQDRFLDMVRTINCWKCWLDKILFLNVYWLTKFIRSDARCPIYSS